MNSSATRGSVNRSQYSNTSSGSIGIRDHSPRELMQQRSHMSLSSAVKMNYLSNRASLNAPRPHSMGSVPNASNSLLSSSYQSNDPSQQQQFPSLFPSTDALRTLARERGIVDNQGKVPKLDASDVQSQQQQQQASIDDYNQENKNNNDVVDDVFANNDRARNEEQYQQQQQPSPATLNPSYKRFGVALPIDPRTIGASAATASPSQALYNGNNINNKSNNNSSFQSTDTSLEPSSPVISASMNSTKSLSVFATSPTNPSNNNNNNKQVHDEYKPINNNNNNNLYARGNISNSNNVGAPYTEAQVLKRPSSLASFEKELDLPSKRENELIDALDKMVRANRNLRVEMVTMSREIEDLKIEREMFISQLKAEKEALENMIQNTLRAKDILLGTIEEYKTKNLELSSQVDALEKENEYLHHVAESNGIQIPKYLLGLAEAIEKTQIAPPTIHDQEEFNEDVEVTGNNQEEEDTELHNRHHENMAGFDESANEDSHMRGNQREETETEGYARVASLEGMLKGNIEDVLAINEALKESLEMLKKNQL